MITEKDFQDAIDNSYSEEQAQVCFSLAQKMAEEFAEWILKSKFTSQDDILWDDAEILNTYTSEELFKLFIEQRS